MTPPDPGPSLAVTHNTALRRFELPCGQQQLAYLSYTEEDDHVVFDHTFVPETLRGRGIAGLLTRAALREAAKRRWKVIPRCSYVAAFVARHPQSNVDVERPGT